MSNPDSGAMLAELMQDTQKAIQGIEERRNVKTDIEKIEAQLEEASKIENPRERSIRTKVLEAEFKKLREDASKEEKDLSQAVFGLDALMESMGQDYENLLKLKPDEEGLVIRAKSELQRAEQQKTLAQNKWNIFGARDKAIALAESAIEKSKQRIKDAEAEAKRLARARLMGANFEQSLQEIMLRVENTIRIMRARMDTVSQQLTAVASRKKQAFTLKEQAAQALEKLEADLTSSESELVREEEAITALVHGSPEYSEQELKISNLKAKVEDIRGRRNSAFTLFQSKEKFAAELEIHERTQTKLRDNLRMWITALQSDTEERVVTFRSRLEAMKAVADQDIAKQLDDIGAEADQRNAEYMARAGSASDRLRMDRVEKHPARIAKIVEVAAAQAEAVAQVRVREQKAIKEFKERYGIDPTNSSFFHYSDKPSSEGAPAEQPSTF